MISIAFLTALQDIIIQWQITHHTMRTIFLLNLLSFLHSSPEPDTHLHVYVPQESEQGNSVLVASFSTVSSKGENLEGLERLELIMKIQKPQVDQEPLVDLQEPQVNLHHSISIPYT